MTHVEGFTIARPLEHYWKSIDGGAWYVESAYAKLLEDIPKDRPVTWVEVGVFQGQSLAWLGVEVANKNLPVTIHAVDTFQGWPGVPQGEELRELFTFNTARIAEALGERFVVHAKPSVEAAAEFADGSLDVVWVDADHTYEGCKQDIAAWWPKVRAGGFIGGDDWAYPGVRMATIEAFPHILDIGSGERFQAPWPWWLVQKGA